MSFDVADKTYLDPLRKCGLRERQRLEREDQILKAAHGMIAEKGYEAVTMDELAERAGISKPTLYHHFVSKEAIVIRAAQIHMEQYIELLDQIDPDIPAIERLQQAVYGMLSQRFGHGSVVFAKARPATLQVVRGNPRFQLLRERMVDKLTALVTASILASPGCGAVHARLITQMLISFLRDGEYDELVTSGQYTREEIVDTLAKTVMQGARLAAELHGMSRDAVSNAALEV